MPSSTTEHYLPDGLPIPVAAGDGLDAPFFEALGRDELVVQRCKECNNWQWGPEWTCYNCHGFDLHFEKVSGKAKIFSWERAWYPVHPALQAKLPYLTVLVELPDAGNIRMVGNLLGDPEQEVTIGADVECVFEHHPDSEPPFTLVQWKTV